MTEEQIRQRNLQYKRLQESKNKRNENAMTYYLSTRDFDTKTWRHRMESTDIMYLYDKGKERIRLKTCKEFQVTPYKLGTS